MAENVSLNSIGNLQDTTTAQTTLNANNALIENAFEDVLSRSGTTPNQMLSNFDMNSNQILNLPAPATANSPVRLVDVTSSSTIASVPPVGTSGAVVGLLNANNTYSGNSIFTGTVAVTGPTLSIGSTTIVDFSGSSGVLGQVLTSNGTSSPTWQNNRITLTGNTNYYVATTGSDSNLGTSGSPWLTLQHAHDYLISNVDFAGFTVTINVAAGTYAGFLCFSPWTGNGDLNLAGAGSSSTFIQCINPGGYCIQCKDLGIITISGFTLEDNGSSNGAGGIFCGQDGVVDIGTDIKFGTISNGSHMDANHGGNINFLENYVISGNAASHFNSNYGGCITPGLAQASISTSLAFGTFAVMSYGGFLDTIGYTTTGGGATSCTGLKFSLDPGGMIASGGVDLNTMFPGNSNGVYNVVGGAGWDNGHTGVIASVTLTSPSLTSATFSNPPTIPTYTVTSLNAISSPATGMMAIVSDST